MPTTPDLLPCPFCGSVEERMVEREYMLALIGATLLRGGTSVHQAVEDAHRLLALARGEKP